MTIVFKLAVLFIGGAFSHLSLAEEKLSAPDWSTPERTKVSWHEPSPTKKLTLVGSSKIYTLEEIDDKYSAPEWFPEQHKPMPEIVKYGKGKRVWACASCHLASGMGHPESARLAGLSSNYMQAQMKAFASGDRNDYSGHMNRMAPLLTLEETKEISDWFASLKPIGWYQVIESEKVPLTLLDKTRMRIEIQHADVADNAPTEEPLSDRIIEIPVNIERVKKRSPIDGFIAYVKPGSLKTGQQLVTTGSGKTTPCIACHGPDLNGTVIAPNIAGLSPIYTIRQLYSFKNGLRKGQEADAGKMMSAVSKNFQQQDIYAIAAYLATLPITTQ